jgi:hypothetical protein
VNLVHFRGAFGVKGNVVWTGFVSIMAQIAVLWTGRPNFDCERDASGSFKPPDGARRVRAGELGREPLGLMKSESGEERIIEDNRSRRVAH